MGAWGDGPFENDDAADWMFELKNADDVGRFLLETFEAAHAEVVDASDASRAIAAAVWLTATPTERHGVEFGAVGEPPVPTPELRRAGARALESVLEQGSEWRELWEDAGEDAPIQYAELVRSRLVV